MKMKLTWLFRTFVGMYMAMGVIHLDAIAHEITFSENSDVSFAVLENSMESYQLLLAGIDSVEHYLELCPCMTGGPMLAEILEHVDARMDQCPDLITHFLAHPTFLWKEDLDLIASLAKKWPERFHYVIAGMPPTSSFLTPNVIELHAKLSIFDGKYFLIGGTNFEEFMCNYGDRTPEPSNSPRSLLNGVKRPLAFRDQDIMGMSVLVSDALRREYYKQFQLWKYHADTKWFIEDPERFDEFKYPLDTDIANKTVINHFNDFDIVNVPAYKIKFYFSGPHTKINPINQAYIKLIKEAKNSISISNMYFIPTNDIYDSIVAACNRGVKVDLVTNGITDLSPSFTGAYAWGSRVNYLPLYYGKHFKLWQKSQCLNKKVNSNVNVYEFYVTETQYHKKCMCVDDRFFVIGSYNLGRKSAYYDYEVVVVIDSSELVTQVKKIFDKDKSLSLRVKPSTVVDWYFTPHYYFLGSMQINYMPA